MSFFADRGRFNMTLGEAALDPLAVAQRVSQAQIDTVPFGEKRLRITGSTNSYAVETNAPQISSLIAKPLGRNISTEFIQGTSVFTSIVDRPTRDTVDVSQTAFDLQTLNYLLELHAMMSVGSAIDKGTLQYEAYKWASHFGSLLPTAAVDFPYMIGSPGIVGELPPRVAYKQRKLDTTDSLIAFTSYGTAMTQNIWAGSIKPGDNLFYTCSMVELNDSDYLVDANGYKKGRRSGVRDCILQVLPYNAREQYVVPADSSIMSTGLYTSSITTLKPNPDDLNYIASTRAATEFREYVYDPDLETFRVVRTLEQEGLQEAINALPQTVWDAYHYGSAVKAGTAATGRMATNSQKFVRRLSRNRTLLANTIQFQLLVNL